MVWGGAVGGVFVGMDFFWFVFGFSLQVLSELVPFLDALPPLSSFGLCSLLLGRDFAFHFKKTRFYAFHLKTVVFFISFSSFYKQ